MLKKLLAHLRRNGATVPLFGGRVGITVSKAFSGLTFTKRW